MLLRHEHSRERIQLFSAFSYVIYLYGKLESLKSKTLGGGARNIDAMVDVTLTFTALSRRLANVRVI